jgi:hypothetical protein
MAWNLSGLACIQLILNHSIKTELSFSSIKINLSKLSSTRQGVVVSIIIQRTMFNKIKDVINKNVE